MPRSLNQDISAAVESVLLQALAHNPDERFPHTQAFADAYLRALMGLPMKVEIRQAKPPFPKTLGADTAIKGERSEADGDLSPKQDTLRPPDRIPDLSRPWGEEELILVRKHPICRHYPKMQSMKARDMTPTKPH